jgi:transposase InsO family protein
LNSSESRQELLVWIAEAVAGGARESLACELSGVTQRTLQRWRTGKLKDERKGASKVTARKLSDAERDAVYQTATLEKYADQTPEQIVAILSQEELYLASPSTFYRILRDRNAVQRRQESKTPIRRYQPPERVATGPNQVWTWDITWLSTDVKGRYLYAYVIIDIWDRSIVGWAIHESEHGDYSRALFERVCRELQVKPIYLHSDNGGPMKAYTLVEFLYSMNIMPSTSRPRVSNDNPFSESLFKTLKYRASYPRFFRNQLEAMKWFANFVDWYNTKHLHSGLAFVTPQQRRLGFDKDILATRNQTLSLARERFPLRWGMRPAKIYEITTEVVLNAAA